MGTFLKSIVSPNTLHLVKHNRMLGMQNAHGILGLDVMSYGG